MNDLAQRVANLENFMEKFLNNLNKINTWDDDPMQFVIELQDEFEDFNKKINN